MELLISLIVNVLAISISIYFGIEQKKMRHVIKRIGQLSSQSKSICASLDSLEEDLINQKIDANGALSVLKTIKKYMYSLNGEIESIYNEYIKKE